MTLLEKFTKQNLGDRQSMLTIGELNTLCSELKTALQHRNEVEGKAHALFTEPLSNGQTFAHTPGQCDPLGFVTVLRASIEKLMSSHEEDKHSIGQLIKTLRQWRDNWNVPQWFAKQDISLEIVNLELMLKRQPLSNPFILPPISDKL